MVELGNDLLYPCSGAPHGEASVLGCRCFYLPGTSCLLQETYLSSHKQALLAVPEIAVISMVRAAQTGGKIMTLQIKGQKEVS